MAKRKPKKQASGKPPPMCKAILLCDAVLSDPFSRKSAIVGIFENFIVPAFPGMTTPFFVFMQMTNGIGRYQITVEIRRLGHGGQDETIARASVAEMEFKDRAAKSVLIIPVPPLPLPAAGEYDFIVLADGQEIDRQQFNAVSRPEEPHAADSPKTPEDQE